MADCFVDSGRARVERADPPAAFRLVVDEHVGRCDGSLAHLARLRLVTRATRVRKLTLQERVLFFVV